MSKGSGTTRSGSASSPRGIASPFSTSEQSRLYAYAERLADEGRLAIDPGDATYAKVGEFSRDTIVRTIEAGTDYDVLDFRNSAGDIAIDILDRNSNPSDYEADDDGRREVVISDVTNLAKVLQELNRGRIRRGQTLRITR